MRKTYFIGGGLLLVVLVVASAVGYLWMRSPTLVTQTPSDPIIDPDEKPSAYLCLLSFQEGNGRQWQYGVATYGRKVPLGPGPGSFTVSVDGNAVEVSPADGGLWAVGPDLKLHRLGLSFRDVSEGMARGAAGEFVRGPLWKERLKPELEKYRWPEL